MDKKKLKLSISGNSKKTIDNIQQAKINPKNTVIIKNNKNFQKKKFYKPISGDNFKKTKDMLENDKCFPIEKVVECCEWLINSKRQLVGGRNFSAVHDPWNDEKINLILRKQ